MLAPSIIVINAYFALSTHNFFSLAVESGCIDGQCAHPRAKYWVSCDVCGEWFHCLCVKVDVKAVKDLDYLCFLYDTCMKQCLCSTSSKP